MPATLLQMRNIYKRFDGTVALDNVDFDVKKSSVHALLGKNGAGKSTLVKILMGVYPPNEGEIFLNGKHINFTSPHEAQENGIGIVYQDFSLIPDLSVAENIFLGRLPKNQVGLIYWKCLYKRASEILEKLNCPIDPKKKVSTLSVAEKQLVEIASAISTNPQILILDEPTSALSESEIAKLFETIKILKKNHKVGIIYISHRLQEIQQIADFVTIIRDGKIVAEGEIDKFSQEEIVHHIIGEISLSNKTKVSDISNEVVLEVKNISRKGEFQNISFELFKGEILGIAGLVGSKRTELIKSLFGVTNIDSGEILLNGSEIRKPNPNKMIKAGIVYTPEDRKNEGIINILSINKNLSLANFRYITEHGFIDRRKEKTFNSTQVEKYEIKTSNLEDNINSLSGGNQQKVVLAKMLATKPKIILLDEPTRGIDVGAKMQIFRLLKELSASGVGIIFISSELEEVVEISDRIIILANGKMTDIIHKTDEINAKALMVKASCCKS